MRACCAPRRSVAFDFSLPGAACPLVTSALGCRIALLDSRQAPGGGYPSLNIRRARWEATMLALRPSCECCDRDLPPDSGDAVICSFECTFCRDCADRLLNGRCPNCGGELVRRPVRPAAKLAKYPPSGQRIFKPEGCKAASTA
jgi:hypothetical protein